MPAEDAPRTAEMLDHFAQRATTWHAQSNRDAITVPQPGRAGRLEELAIHPTVKPVALVADAIKDCSRRGGLVLDPFCGSGTILIAAERTGRKARALEVDPT
jgi:DNA modification methylase